MKRSCNVNGVSTGREERRGEEREWSREGGERDRETGCRDERTSVMSMIYMDVAGW